jgi:RNA polymerase sigma factor (sigma-70 family)
LVRAHQAQVYQLCLAFLGDPHEAEEAAQSAFIKAYRGLGRFQGHAAFRTWITRIGINHCKDVLKSRRRNRLVSLDSLLEEGAPVPPALVSEPGRDKETIKRVPEAALRRLSRGERAVLEMAGRGSTIDYVAMADELGLTRDGVKGRLKRARQKVRKYLKRTGY